MWPLICAFTQSFPEHRAASFERVCQHTAMGDLTEMHLFKMMARCRDECNALAKRFARPFMCAAAKAVCASYACSRVVCGLGAQALALASIPGSAIGIGAEQVSVAWRKVSRRDAAPEGSLAASARVRIIAAMQS